MDHESAIRLRTSERYTLGELSSTERDEFEEHYFDCPECAEDVRLGAMLRANVRAVLSEPKAELKLAPAPRASWLDLLRGRPLVAASAVLNVVLLVGMAALAMRPGGLDRAEFYALFFVPAPARSGDPVKTVPRGASMVGLFFDLTEEELRIPAFSYRLLNQAGAVQSSETLPAPEVRQFQLCLALPVTDLKPGSYHFILSGVGDGAQNEIRRLQLEVPK